MGVLKEKAAAPFTCGVACVRSMTLSAVGGEGGRAVVFEGACDGGRVVPDGAGCLSYMYGRGYLCAADFRDAGESQGGTDALLVIIKG